MKPLLHKMFTGCRKTIALVLVLTVLMSLFVPTAAFAEDETPAADSEIYAMLYYADIGKHNSDGQPTEVKNIEMVLQKGSQPDPSKTLITDSDGKQGIIKSTKVDAYPAWYSFAPTANNYNIVKIDFKDKLRPSSIAGWFRNCRLVTEENFLHKENLDTTECTDMQYAFYLCSGMKSIDFTQWTNFKAEKVRKLSYFLSDCTSIITADLTTLHPGECTEAQYVFKNCTGLTKVKLDDFNITENIKGKAYMNNFFMNCKKLETVGNSAADSVNLSEFKAPKPMSYDSMFRGCTSLRKADLSKLGEYNTNDAVYISNMFYDCTSLEEIDMTNFRIEFSPRNFLVNARALRELKVPDATKTNNLGKNESRALFQYADKLSYVEISSAWKQNAALTYLPNQNSEDTVWIKTKGDNDSCHVGTSLTAKQLFKQFQPAYAGGWSTLATFEFKGNGGTPESQTVTGLKETQIDTTGVSAPTRDGYKFAGWYSEPDGEGEKFEGTADYWTYYAKWEDIQYTLKLNANGGHKDGNPSVDTSEQTLLYSDWVGLGNGGFVKEGKVLVGWNTRQDGTGVSYTAIDTVGMLTTTDGAEITLYAMWGENAATVTFEPQGGSAVSDKHYNQLPADYGILSESARDGYTFMGWFTEEGTKIKENDPVTGDITLYAHWEKDPVVTFNANGGFFKAGDTQTVSESKLCSYGGPVGYITVPGHHTATFLGWFTEESGGEQISSDTIVTTDVTFYAHWGYKPVLDTDGGIIEGSFEGFPSADSPENYKIEELPEVRKDNYTFDGWYHGDTKVEEDDTIDLSSDKIIKAKWIRKDSVTITLNPNGGTLPDNTSNTFTVYSGNTAASLPTPSREGYDFEGWFTAASGGEQVKADTVVSSDMTVYAHWAKLECKVTFHPGKGTLLGDSEVYIARGKPMDYIPGIYNPAAGETFIGWYTEEGGKGTKLNSDTVITEDTDYYPYWDMQLVIDTDTGVNFMAKWETASDSNVTDIGNYLVFHPANNNQVTATLKVVLMMEGVQQKPVPIGALKLKVPRYVFEDYKGKPVGTDNLSAMASDKYELSSDDDYYIFTNKVEIRSDFDTFTIDYTVTPRQVNGGYYDENEIAHDYLKKDDLKVILDIDKSSYDVAEEHQHEEYIQDLGLEFHTKVYTTPSKTRSNVSMEWNESWGTRPADADEYFYVTWALNSDHANTSSQRFKLLWDEDTYGRDGSIVYTSGAVSYNEDTQGKWTGWRTNGRSTAYVVTKHRRDQATTTTADGDVWAKVHNEAVLNVQWESGYQQHFRVSAETTAYIPPSGSGASSFTKTVPNSNNNEAHYVHGGQELILSGEEDNMPKLAYEIKYSESYNVDNPKWDAGTERYVADERTYTLTECDDRDHNDVMISSCGNDLSQDSWNNSYGLVDGDYYFDQLTITLTEYNATKIGPTQWSNPQEHPVRSDYLPVEVLIRRQNSTEFESYKTVTIPKEGATVALPEDTAGFKLVHSSTAYTTNITVKTNVCLKPSALLKTYVTQAVRDGKYTVIKNKAQMDVDVDNESHTHRTSKIENNGSWPSTYVLDMSAIHLFARKDCADTESDITYDSDTLTESFPAVMSGWNYNNSGNKTLFKTGEFYDLLPKDYSVDRDSIFINPIRENWSETYYHKTAKIKANLYNNAAIRSDTLPKSAYSVRMIENWENTGRTMMIVRVSVPDSVRATGVNVFYQMKVRYTSINANGVTQNNIVAFKDTTAGQIVPESKSTAIGEGDVPVELISHFTQFDGDNTAYASDNTYCVEPPVRESGLSSVVYTEDSEMTEHELVGLNTDYCYHITYTSGVNAMCDDLVFYNVLEHRIDGAESEWQGEFLGVDVSAIEAAENANNKGAKCAPVVYYSTADKSSFRKNNYGQEDDSFNLDPEINPGLWTTEPPADLSTVTAIAVDCRKDNKDGKYYLDAEKTLDFKINMKSISDKSRNDIYAYNETVIRFNLSALETDNRVHLLSKTDVQLHFNTPQLDKTSFPASGTAEEPTPVVKGSTLNYTIKVTNPDDAVTMNDVVVEDSFNTSQVKVNLDNVTVRLGDDADSSLSGHARIRDYELTNDGSFTATIGTLEPHETMFITVPVEVIGTEGQITNTAHIDSVNGVVFDVTSPTTYHKIDSLKLKVAKVNSKGDPLAGATLNILKDDGSETEEASFVSTTAPTVINITPGSYILRETDAPSGYRKADDIRFRVASDGVVYINDETFDSVTMVNEPAYKVVFHENNPTIDDKDVVFKTVESIELPENNADKKIEHFYDIPEWAGDEYVFAGWYYADDEGAAFAQDASKADTPLNFETQTYPPTDEDDPQDYHLYAHWIAVGSVTKDAEDTNIFKGGYRGFGLCGVQIRKEKGENGEDMYDPNEREDGAGGEQYSGEAVTTPAGMRFITSLSENLLSQIYAIDKIPDANEDFGVEYGYAVGTLDNINTFIDHYKPDDTSKYKLQYNGANVNGKDTSAAGSFDTDFRYISNVNCTSKQGPTASTGVVKWDHRNYDDYRLYTLVVTYDDEESALKKDKKIDARAYLRYYDANGKLRVFYNNYRNNMYYGGCLCSFNQAMSVVG